jgi:hypothetical protein
MTIADEPRFCVNGEVLSRVLDGEAVLLDLGSGSYFGLNEVATLIWSLLERGATLAELERQVVAEFEVDEATVHRELEVWLRDLLARGLIRAG